MLIKEGKQYDAEIRFANRAMPNVLDARITIFDDKVIMSKRDPYDMFSMSAGLVLRGHDYGAVVCIDIKDGPFYSFETNAIYKNSDGCIVFAFSRMYMFEMEECTFNNIGSIESIAVKSLNFTLNIPNMSLSQLMFDIAAEGISIQTESVSLTQMGVTVDFVERVDLNKAEKWIEYVRSFYVFIAGCRIYESDVSYVTDQSSALNVCYKSRRFVDTITSPRGGRPRLKFSDDELIRQNFISWLELFDDPQVTEVILGLEELHGQGSLPLRVWYTFTFSILEMLLVLLNIKEKKPDGEIKHTIEECRNIIKGKPFFPTMEASINLNALKYVFNGPLRQKICSMIEKSRVELEKHGYSLPTEDMIGEAVKLRDDYTHYDIKEWRNDGKEKGLIAPRWYFTEIMVAIFLIDKMKCYYDVGYRLDGSFASHWINGNCWWITD